MTSKYLKKLSDYKEDIHRCSKCGLCQAVCPLYEHTGNECTVSRGLFIMLDGVIKNKLQLNKNINKYLDLCLKCNKCSEFCPSNIDVTDILLCAKNEYFKNSAEGKIYSFFESKYIFDTVLKIIKFITGLFVRKTKSKTFETKAIYFGGCISAIKPDVSNFVTKLLNKMNIEAVDSDMTCCGMPFLTTGNFDRFMEVINENISKIPQNVSLIITDCASCEWAWNNYIKYVNDETLKNKLKQIKIKSIYELLDENEITFQSKKETTVSYHKPCHEKNYKSIQKIINTIQNCHYTELEDYDKCCGFASYEHPQTLKQTKPIRESKKQSMKSSSAKTILSSCVGCIISLKMLTKKKVCRLIEFLKDDCTTL